MTATKSIGKIPNSQVEETVTKVFTNINDIDPATVQCMMGVIVIKPEEGSELNGVHVYAIGDGDEIPNMIKQLIESASSGVREVEANEENLASEGVVH